MKAITIFTLSLLPLFAADSGGSFGPRRKHPQQVQIQFMTGQPAEDQMYQLTNGVLDWRDMVMIPAGQNGYFKTNQTLMVGWHPIEAKVTTPENMGRITDLSSTGPGVSSGMLYTYGSVRVDFAEPVAAVAMPIQFGYRFGWQISMEALDKRGNSLGEIQENGYTMAPYSPVVYAAAIASKDAISAVIVSASPSYMCPTGCLYVGMAQIRQTPLAEQ